MNRLGSAAPLNLLIAIALLTLTGCTNDDDRMWELSQEITEASRELVEADAEARKEIIEVHHDLQEERASLDRQHEELEAERREIAAHRHRDPLIANALLTTGLILGSLLPLLIAWLLLKEQFSRSDDAQLAEILTAEITAADSLLLTERQDERRLLGPDKEASTDDDRQADG